jgi:phosphatidyl-myo-inositol dimannoside synthase
MEFQKYILFAPEYPPYQGGIAQYSLGLAKRLSLDSQLKQVVTLQSNPDLSVEVVAPKSNIGLKISFTLLRKLFSASYLIYQKVWFWRLMMRFTTKDHIIITSLFFDYSEKMVDWCSAQGIKYDVVLHGLDMIELSESKPVFLQKALTNAHGFIFNSENTKKQFESAFPNLNQKRQVIHPIFDQCAYDQHEIMALDRLQKELKVALEGRKIIVSISRLVKRKGIDKSVQAIVPFLEAHPDWIYLIAGSGDEKEFIQNLIPSHLKDRIVLLGSVSDQVKCSLLSYAKVFIMLNQDFGGGDVEGFGISFVEATYFKCWVIGGNNGGVPEAVDTTSNAFLIDMDDETYGQKVIEALNYILLQSSATMLEKGRQFVIDKFALVHPSK